MKLFLVRHTRTNYNELELCNSDPSVDVHLTEVGIAQAEALASSLRGVVFDMIMTSELPRTKQTAKIINQYHGVPIESDGDLNDIRAYEGRSYDEYDAGLMGATDKWNYKLIGEESLRDLSVRAQAFLTRLSGRDVQSVLVVTHQDTAKVLIGILDRLTEEETMAVTVPHGTYREYEI